MSLNAMINDFLESKMATGPFSRWELRIHMASGQCLSLRESSTSLLQTGDINFRSDRTVISSFIPKET